MGMGCKEICGKIETMESLDKVVLNNERFLLFKQKAFKPLQHLPDHDIVSSLVKLSDEVKRWRAIGVGIVIAFVSLALTLLNFQANLYREQKTTSQQVFQLQGDLATAGDRIRLLEHQASITPQAKVPAPGTTPVHKGRP
jgi:hypothetical protein